MLEKFTGGVIPAPGAYTDLDREVIAQAEESIAGMKHSMENLEVSTALTQIFKLVSRTNKYIDESAPWALAKQPDQAERLHTVLYTMAESLRVSAVLLVPFLVETPSKIWQQLGIEANPSQFSHQDVLRWGWLRPGIKVQKGNPIFPRIEEEKTMETQPAKEMVPAETKPAPVHVEDKISIDEFAKIDLRVAKVISAERIEGSDKLLKLMVKVGEEQRQIVAGIAQHYQP
jgi:methionyl-tRNA synthetase